MHNFFFFSWVASDLDSKHVRQKASLTEILLVGAGIFCGLVMAAIVHRQWSRRRKHWKRKLLSYISFVCLSCGLFTYCEKPGNGLLARKNLKRSEARTKQNQGTCKNLNQTQRSQSIRINMRTSYRGPRLDRMDHKKPRWSGRDIGAIFRCHFK